MKNDPATPLSNQLEECRIKMPMQNPAFEHALNLCQYLERHRLALRSALQGILDQPYGCSLCDSGVPRNEEKGHQPDCPYELAQATLKMTETKPKDKHEK